MLERLDIVDIKLLVKREVVKFYTKDGLIYMKDLETNECVIVGEVSDDG